MVKSRGNEMIVAFEYMCLIRSFEDRYGEHVREYIKKLAHKPDEDEITHDEYDELQRLINRERMMNDGRN